MPRPPGGSGGSEAGGHQRLIAGGRERRRAPRPDPRRPADRLAQPGPAVDSRRAGDGRRGRGRQAVRAHRQGANGSTSTCRRRSPPGSRPKRARSGCSTQDESLIVVDKPAGLTVHPGAGRPTGTLVHRLLAHFPDLEGVGGPGRPGIVHRLDKDTSGVLVVARTQAAYRLAPGGVFVTTGRQALPGPGLRCPGAARGARRRADRASPGPPHPHDRPAGRPTGPVALSHPGRGAGGGAARGRHRHRADAPDPGPPQVDPSPDRRRPDLRRGAVEEPGPGRAEDPCPPSPARRSTPGRSPSIIRRPAREWPSKRRSRTISGQLWETVTGQPWPPG